MKRVFALAAALALALSLTAPTALAAKSFTDVSRSDWYYDTVNAIVDEGLMVGVGSGAAFDPKGTVTRGTVVQTLYRLAGKPEAKGKNPFKDVSDKAWYAAAAVWAAGTRVASGYGGYFSPEAPITRQELAVMLYNYERAVVGGFTGGADMALVGFADAGDVDVWALDAMRWCADAGVINGQQIGAQRRLAPHQNATRVELATVLLRYVRREK